MYIKTIRGISYGLPTREGAMERTSRSPSALKSLRLTDRESEVLLWVSQGKTDTEIGTILGLSPKTVGKHLERIYQKLGVETRTAAAMRVLTLPDVS